MSRDGHKLILPSNRLVSPISRCMFFKQCAKIEGKIKGMKINKINGAVTQCDISL